jgi:hypothetical protein
VPGVKCVWCMVDGFRFRVEGLGMRFSGRGYRVWGLRFRESWLPTDRRPASTPMFLRFCGSGLRVSGFWFRVYFSPDCPRSPRCTGFMVWSLGFRVQD